MSHVFLARDDLQRMIDALRREHRQVIGPQVREEIGRASCRERV